MPTIINASCQTSDHVVTDAESQTEIDVQNIRSQTTTVECQDTDGKLTQNTGVSTAIHLFRSWRDALSNFHPTTLKTDEGVFKSAEHLYQYRLLTHHKKWHEAEQCKHAKHAGKAKSIAAIAVTSHSASWRNQEEVVMESICTLKLAQSPIFCKELLSTGDKKLFHNMESDAHWGIGKDGLGENKLGVILEKVRKAAHESSTFENQQNESAVCTSKTKLVVLGDSMLRGIQHHLEQDGSVDVQCNGGAKVSDLIQNILTLPDDIDTVVVHVGTNNLTSGSRKETVETFKLLVSNILWLTKCRKIILSGIIYRLDNGMLKPRIDAINNYLQSLESDRVTFVDHNPTIRNLHRILQSDGLHLRVGGTRQIAENIRIALMGGPTAQHTQRHDRSDTSGRRTAMSRVVQRPRPINNRTPVMQRNIGRSGDNSSSTNHRWEYSAKNQAVYSQTQPEYHSSTHTPLTTSSRTGVNTAQPTIFPVQCSDIQVHTPHHVESTWRVVPTATALTTHTSPPPILSPVVYNSPPMIAPSESVPVIAHSSSPWIPGHTPSHSIVKPLDMGPVRANISAIQMPTATLMSPPMNQQEAATEITFNPYVPMPHSEANWSPTNYLMQSPPPNSQLSVNPPWVPWTVSTVPTIPWGNVPMSHAW